MKIALFKFLFHRFLIAFFCLSPVLTACSAGSPFSGSHLAAPGSDQNEHPGEWESDGLQEYFQNGSEDSKPRASGADSCPSCQPTQSGETKDHSKEQVRISGRILLPSSPMDTECESVFSPLVTVTWRVIESLTARHLQQLKQYPSLAFWSRSQSGTEWKLTGRVNVDECGHFRDTVIFPLLEGKCQGFIKYEGSFQIRGATLSAASEALQCDTPESGISPVVILLQGKLPPPEEPLIPTEPEDPLESWEAGPGYRHRRPFDPPQPLFPSHPY